MISKIHIIVTDKYLPVLNDFIERLNGAGFSLTYSVFTDEKHFGQQAIVNAVGKTPEEAAKMVIDCLKKKDAEIYGDE